MPQQLVSLLPIILMFVLFYFLIIRPQYKKDKRLGDEANLKTDNRYYHRWYLWKNIKYT